MNVDHIDMNQVDHDMHSSNPDMEIIFDDMNAPQDSSLLPDAEVDPLSRCMDDLVPSLTWFNQQSTTELQGEFEFAQTHVIRYSLTVPAGRCRDLAGRGTPRLHHQH